MICHRKSNNYIRFSCDLTAAVGFVPGSVNHEKKMKKKKKCKIIDVYGTY